MPRGYLIEAGDLDPSYKGACFFGVTPMPKGANLPTNMILLGDVFLRNFYSVYDWDNSQVQLAINKDAADRVDIRDPLPFYMGEYFLLMLALNIVTGLLFY